jgi:hypothetical protein
VYNSGDWVIGASRATGERVVIAPLHPGGNSSTMGFIMYSSNYGQSFTKSVTSPPATFGYQDIVLSPTGQYGIALPQSNGSNTSYGIWYTSDYGVNWSMSNISVNITAELVTGRNGTILISTSGQHAYLKLNGINYYSNTYGQTWLAVASVSSISKYISFNQPNSFFNSFSSSSIALPAGSSGFPATTCIINGQTQFTGDVMTYKNLYGKAPPTTVYDETFIPNTIDASGRTTWVNKNVTWTATASSNSNAFTSPYTAFIPNSNLTASVASGVNFGWNAGTASYNGTTGTPTGQYNAGVYYTSIQNATAANSTLAVSGEWLQIQSSVPVVMTSFNFSTIAFSLTNSASRLPYKFYICGSNDNNNWSPIVYGVWASLPIATGTAPLNPTSTYVINGTNSLTSNTNYVSTASTSPDNKLNYITYGNNSTPYSAFRVVVQSVIASNLGSTAEGTTTSVGFLFNPRFSVTTQTGPSRTLLYMDPLNINQLDVSGSLAFINSNLPTILTVTPNMAGVLTSNTWSNNNVSWVSSASSILDTTTESFKAFNGIHSSNDCWHDNQTGWTATTGGSPANSTFQTPVFATGTSGTINTYNGQWLQIQASIPLVMKTFYFGGRGTQPARLPQFFYIVGSNTGTGSWTPIFKGTTTSTTGAVLSGTVSLSGLAPSAAGTISNFYGSTALTYDNTYGNTASSFTYFRLIVSRICSNETTCNIGEWGLTFDKATTTTNSSVSLALDNAVPNQLNVGGALGLAGGITPMYYMPTFGPGQVGYSYFAPVPKDISVALNSSAELARLTNVPPGVWLVCTCMCYYGSATNARVKLYVGTTSGITDVLGVQMIQIVNGDYMGHSGSIVYNNTSTNTFYLNMAVNAAGPVKTYTESERMSFIQATRIA